MITTDHQSIINEILFHISEERYSQIDFISQKQDDEAHKLDNQIFRDIANRINDITIDVGKMKTCWNLNRVLKVTKQQWLIAAGYWNL